MSQNNKEDVETDPTPLFTNPQQLEQVLYALTQPNNDDLRKATLLIKEFLQSVNSVKSLAEQIDKSQKAEVRQVAAVYLREQLEHYWKKLDYDTQNNIKKFLLNKLLKSDIKTERVAIASCIASTAKFTLIKDEWNELLGTLDQLCKPNQPDNLREIGVTLWRNCIQFCGGALKKHFAKILPIFQNALKETNLSKIQVEALKGIGGMVEFLEHENEVKIIEEIVPSMVQVIQDCLKRQDEENVIAGMNVFNDLIECKIPVLRKHALQLAQFNLQIAGAKGKLPISVRKQGANFLIWMCKSKPKTVLKHNLIQPFLSLCINFVIESQEKEEAKEEKKKQAALNSENTKNGKNNDDNKEEDDDDEEDEDAETNFSAPLAIACDLLDEIFLNIPSESCFPIAIAAIQQLIDNQDASKRKGAYITIAMMAEGCNEIIAKKDNLTLLLKACLKGISDNNHTCRRCALEAITQLATHLQPEVVKLHKIILPEIFKIFQKKNENLRVIERALSAVEMFIEPMDDDDSDFDVKTYLKPIMATIKKCMEHPSKDLQAQALSTLASIASSVKQDFIEFLPQTLSLLEQLLKIENEEQLVLRAEAVCTLGAVANAVGKNHYGPVLLKFHNLVMDGLERFDNNSIRENSFMYFSDLAELMGSDILKMDDFDDILTLLIAVIDDDDGLMVELPDDGFGEAIPKRLLDAEDLMQEEEAKLQDLDDEELEKMLRKHLQNRDENEIEKGLIENGEIDFIDKNNNTNNNEDNEDYEDEDEENENEDNETDDEGLSAVGQMKSVKLQVTSGFMEEKAAAVHALTKFIEHSGKGILKYTDDIWPRLMHLYDYPHTLVKMAFANALHVFFMLIITTELEKQDDAVTTESEKMRYAWKQGDATLKYSDNVQHWIDDVIPLYIQSIIDENDKDVLNLIVDHFIDTLRTLGPSSIDKHMEELIKSINLFLKEKTESQNTGEDEDPDTDKIQTKHRYVTDAIAELIGVLAELWGAKFMPVFERLFPNLLRWSDSSRHPHDQAMVVGCIADICGHLKNVVDGYLMSPYADKIYPLALKVAQSQDVNMRQNALYCIGAMFPCCNQAANLTNSQNCLRCINVYMQLPKDGDVGQQLVRDNACSALCKIITSEPEILPSKELIPKLFDALPLTADYTENYHIYTNICSLILNNKDIVMPFISQALNILAQALTFEEDRVENRTKTAIAKLFRTIVNDKQIQDIIMKELPQQAQNAIKKCLE